MQARRRGREALLLRIPERLRTVPVTLKLLISPVRVRGLWAALDLSRLQFLVHRATRYEREVDHHLETMLTRWNSISAPVQQHLALVVDSQSVKALAGVWPQSNMRDRQYVDSLFLRKDFFSK